jgi:hypothetical protein
MTVSRVRYIAALAVASVAVAAGASGITYAATTTPPRVVYACINSQGVLKLLVSGHCAAGFSKVGIDRAGVRGKRGPKGLTGAAGPGLQAASARSTTSATDAASIVVAGMQLTVYLVCDVGSSGQAGVYIINNNVGGSDFTVVGSALVRNAGGSPNIVHHGVSQPDLPEGPSLIDIDEPGDEPVAVEIRADSSGGGSVQFRADVTVHRGAASFVLRLYLDQNPTKCLSQATVSPPS